MRSVTYTKCFLDRKPLLHCTPVSQRAVVIKASAGVANKVVRWDVLIRKKQMCFNEIQILHSYVSPWLLYWYTLGFSSFIQRIEKILLFSYNLLRIKVSDYIKHCVLSTYPVFICPFSFLFFRISDYRKTHRVYCVGHSVISDSLWPHGL